VTIITKGCLLEQAEKEHKVKPANQVQLDNGSQDGIMVEVVNDSHTLLVFIFQKALIP